MADKLTKISILCPAYQEADALGPFHEALYRTLRGLERDYQFEILYVDDGSTDGTLEKMQAIADIDSRVRVLALTRHFGKEQALIAGLEHATGSHVVTLDADLEHPPDLIPQMLEAARDNVDVVMGVAAPQGTAGWKRRLGRGLLTWFCDVVPPTHATDFLVLSRRAVDTLLTTPEQHRNLLGLIFWLDLPRTEIPFEPGKRSAGVSKSSLRNHCTRGIDTVFATSRRPLHAVSAIGALLLAIGVLLALWFPLQSLLRPDTVWFSWCYLIVLVHIVGGSVLCGIGVLGAYLVRVLEQVKQRPLYVLKYDSKASVPKVLPFAPTRDLAA